MRIIISTEFERLNRVIGTRRIQKNINLIQDSLFIGYCHTENKFVALKSDSNIVLIKDTATKELLVNAKINFNKETDYFLHHTNANGLVNEQANLFGNKIQNGAHETNEDDFYKPVFDIILGNSNDKFNEILKKLKLTDEEIKENIDLKSKLDFLHYIYNGGKPSEYEGDKSFAIEEMYKIFEETQYSIDLDMDADESRGADQRKYLIALRNVLLEE
jgi:hypothetical protein